MSESPSPRPQRTRRGRSRTPRGLSEGPSDSEQQATQPRSRRNDRQVQRRHEALGGLLQKGGNQDQVGGGSQKKDALKLRLDLNLDIEVTIKAKVHGDVTLSLL